MDSKVKTIRPRKTAKAGGSGKLRKNKDLVVEGNVAYLRRQAD